MTGYWGFFRADYLQLTQAAWGIDVIFVPGNHEYYEEDIGLFTLHLESEIRQNPKIHLLQNQSIELNDVIFHGATLWTGFEGVGYDKETNRKNAYQNIRDFYAIKYNHMCLTPAAMEGNYHTARDFLRRALTAFSKRKQVVVTHFPPTPRLSVCRKNDKLTPYFYANCEDLIRDHQPNLWIYGHSHCSHETEIEETKVCSNQPGYNKDESFTATLNPKYIDT